MNCMSDEVKHFAKDFDDGPEGIIARGIEGVLRGAARAMDRGELKPSLNCLVTAIAAAILIAAAHGRKISFMNGLITVN